MLQPKISSDTSSKSVLFLSVILTSCQYYQFRLFMAYI